MAKALKSQQKEQQEEERTKLDSAFDKLLQTQAIVLKPTKRDKADKLLQSLSQGRKGFDSDRLQDVAGEKLDDYDKTVLNLL
jgi:hypothetical protein